MTSDELKERIEAIEMELMEALERQDYLEKVTRGEAE